MRLLTILTIAYFSCSISGAKISCDFFKTKNPQKQGSKNLGATNMYRIAGLKPALLTLAIDFFKPLPTLYLSTLVHMTIEQQVSVCIACILGHIAPIYNYFKGGKGVATALACLCFMTPGIALLAVVYWLASIATTRISFVSSLLTAYSALLWTIMAGYDHAIVIGYACIAFILTMTHLPNISSSSALLSNAKSR
ncbi:MAG: hypothetical protein CMF46_01435 [Legionellales bacterium]|nr:hypothetical protein [Legionellales bacterium]|tara:strand:+ start:103 stop:687 length:585 start_codon:yes stop_codon:yes gene_type:complete